jgi:hypothetical protein
MGTFENPDLCASAARIVCLNHFASIAALRKKIGFEQPDSNLAPKLHFSVCAPVLSLVEGSKLFSAADIFFKQSLPGLFAFLFARAACFFAGTASIPQYQPRVQLAGGWVADHCRNRKMEADCPPVVSDHSGPVCLRGASRQAMNF